jgi:hypothetical protein
MSLVFTVLAMSSSAVGNIVIMIWCTCSSIVFAFSTGTYWIYIYNLHTSNHISSSTYTLQHTWHAHEVTASTFTIMQRFSCMNHH